MLIRNVMREIGESRKSSLEVGYEQHQQLVDHKVIHECGKEGVQGEAIN